MKEDYYFYPPKSPQFFFPIKEFNQFKKYYTPYSLKSKLFWVVFKNSILVRFFFKIAEEKIPLPIAQIKKSVNLKGATFFYNIGSKGIEQKATIICKSKDQQRFLKFGQKKRAKELIENEAFTLKNLENQSILKTAKVFDFKISDNFTYILTEVIEGSKVNFTTLNDNVFKLLLSLTKLNTDISDFDKIFAHGDFCPWNMLRAENNELVLIDWEMAGPKPLGYDLFTYIFQTNFLLFPNKKTDTIVRENQVYIKRYFKGFNIDNWKGYLVKFVKIKIEKEVDKPNSVMLSKYQELLLYNND